MGEPALHMLTLYRLTGFAVPEGFAGRPDHLVLLLEFMAHLVEHRGTADQAQFLADHLDWLAALAAAVASREPAPFYPAVLAAALAWVEQERQMLVPAARAGPTPRRCQSRR